MNSFAGNAQQLNQPQRQVEKRLSQRSKRNSHSKSMMINNSSSSSSSRGGGQRNVIVQSVMLLALLAMTTTTFIAYSGGGGGGDHTHSRTSNEESSSPSFLLRGFGREYWNRKSSSCRRTAAAIPKLVGDWERIQDFPVDTGESQGALLGCDIISIGGFFSNFASGPRITYALDLCDPNAQWREMAPHPVEPFLTHAAHASNGDNIMYLCGGYLGAHPGRSIKDCHMFDKTDGPLGSWKALPSLRQTRGGGGLLYMKDENKLLFGLGAQRRWSDPENAIDYDHTWTLDLNNVDFDNPTAGAQWTFRAGGSPYLGNHVTSIVAKDCSDNTRYYIMGGQVGEREKDSNIADVWEYIPASDTFIQRQSLPEPRGHFTTANGLYGCGFIIVGGAIDGDPTVNTWSDDVLYYDIDSDTWTHIGHYPELIKTPVCGVVSDVLYCSNGYTVNGYKISLSFDAVVPTIDTITFVGFDDDSIRFDLMDGMTIDTSTIGGIQKFEIYFNKGSSSSPMTVQSVDADLNQASNNKYPKTVNILPNNALKMTQWFRKNIPYTLIYTPYEIQDLGGTSGSTQSITFTLV